MGSPFDDLVNRVALAVSAGESTLDEGAKEALSCVQDLFAGKPHGYDLAKVTRAVQAKVEAQNKRMNS